MCLAQVTEPCGGQVTTDTEQTDSGTVGFRINSMCLTVPRGGEIIATVTERDP